MPVDPISLEVFKNLFISVSEEMGVTLGRTAYSPNIKERRDYSCALFDPKGRMVAQAAHIPVHLGSMPASVEAAIQQFTFQPGDIVILNDPYLGGTHLPDITLVAPVFVEEGPAGRGGRPSRVLVGYVANRGHHADVGGMTPGSLPLSHPFGWPAGAASTRRWWPCCAATPARPTSVKATWRPRWPP